MDQGHATVLERITAHYPPIVDLNTGASAGIEALAWIVERATAT